MKKRIATLLTVSMALLTVACGTKQTKNSKDAKDASAVKTETNETGETGNTESDKDESAKATENGLGGALGATKLLSVKLSVSADPGSDTVSKDEKFGAAFLNMSPEEFEALGFTLGDSCDITFGNGYSLSDVPYYNGYYVKNGDPVIVAYPGDSRIRITLNNVGIWDAAGLSEGDGVTIQLKEAGKYLAIQEALGQIYSFNRTDYPSDEAFANFRTFSAGNLKENFMYRGASPVDNSRGRAAYVDALLEKNGVKFVIDLADSEANMDTYTSDPDFASAYTKNLYDNGSDVLLDMGSSYMSQTYKEKVAQGFKAALKSEGPIYIHCMEGKDRTGFVCMLVEALAGASFEEMKADYMITYENYFGVTMSEAPEKYDAIVDLYFVPFMQFLHDTDDVTELTEADFSADAAAYLKDGGMSDEEIEAFLTLITK